MKNQKNTLEIEVNCTECDGKGFHEIGPECGYPASNCCGGCYHQETCVSCEDGIITLEFEDDEAVNIIKAVISKDWDEVEESINYKHQIWQGL
jgi:hypothetical protein